MAKGQLNRGPASVLQLSFGFMLVPRTLVESLPTLPRSCPASSNLLVPLSVLAYVPLVHLGICGKVAFRTVLPPPGSQQMQPSQERSLTLLCSASGGLEMPKQVESVRSLSSWRARRLASPMAPLYLLLGPRLERCAPALAYSVR